MAQPLRNTFEKDSPRTPQSPASNISYQTNVNRQKTKKWANAAPANYGGDDWGDDDEYDPPPPPVSKPTGLRQQGQALPGTPRDSPTVDKKYGDLPPLPGAANNPRARANSFDEDDEKRDFSSATVRQPSPPVAAAPAQGPATRFSQITGVPTVRNTSGPPALLISTQQPSQAPVGLRNAKDIVSPVSVSSGSPHPDILKPGRVNASETSSVVSPASDTKTPSSIDYQARRDFSPSAVPQPLTTRASPAPQSASAAEAPSQRFPARKESLSQSAGPPLSDIMQGAPQDGLPKPWTAPVRPSSPGAATRSPISPPAGKPLPFVRPADIYRRNQEEQERQRQSMESSRPSMDSITGAKSSERSDSPAKSQPRASFEDSSDSGRRLMPILEPVNERKSEYGFDGYNTNARKEPEPVLEPETAFDHQEVSDSDKLDVEEVRRQSTSPKLPDLARLSGFGMDLFSQSKPEVPEPSTATEVTPTNAQLSSSSPEDPTLRNQPSFGFTSVVHQAFDRADDSSVPVTPASRTGSTVRRTDSESTGTDGISPIMSRVPSAANPISRREVPSASKLEVVTEPISPEETAQSTPKDESHPEDIRDREVLSFKPGHRRDISTPSPGNSPARTPDLAQPKTFPSGQQAVVAETTTEVSPDDDEPLQPPRPIAEREQSFRPALPGGWTSFATTARSETPTQAPLEDTRNSDAEVSPVNEEGEDFDVTPTTTKHVLPHTERDAIAAGAALGGATGAALGSHDGGNDAGNKDLPTPDLAMAPGGNLYSTTSPDPRLIPKLKQAPPETQLRPDPYRTESDESREAPTPFPKDIPNVSAEAIRSGGHPNVGTNPHDYDAENDKLQKEIVKSLTPRASNAGRSEEPQLEDETTHHQGHESSYLPDYYWSSNNDEQESVPPVPETRKETVVPTSFTVPAPAEVPQVQTEDLPESPTIAPLSPRRTNQSLQTPRPPLANRFSWEKSSEDVSLQPPVEEATKVPTTESRAAPTTFDTILSEPVVPTRDEGPPKTSPLHSPASTTESHLARDTAIVAGGVAAVGVAAAAAHNQQPQGRSDRRLSLAEEKSLATEFGYPVSPTPPEDEHPARSPQPYLSPKTGEPAHPPAPSTVSPTSPVKQQFSPTTTRLLAFKEIAAMTSPHQRIQTFDETRHRFAAMDSGLNDWMSKLQAQYPEHANASGSWGVARMSAPNGTARSKFSKAVGGGAPPLQQPYYQQYLNASSPSTPSTPTGKPSAGQSFPAAGSQQGFSPAGGKSTGHQVQAKGKEFFHTAGVFGGKAGKAGKGLLAKGKNKLRGAGGDKESPPPKPKAERSERRSSWGLPLTLSKSSGRPDPSSRHSKESTPVPTSPPQQNFGRGHSSPQLPPVVAGEPLGHMSGALAFTNSHQSPIEPSVSPEIPDKDPDSTESENKDQLGVPAPIGKTQPSWDPFNATPIAEEDGFQYDERPKQSLFVAEQSNRQGSLSVPVDTAPKSDRSNSEDTKFYDAREETEDINGDWVMVSPEPEVKEKEVETKATKEPEVDKNLDETEPLPPPSMSILNRPRGSYDLSRSPPTSPPTSTPKTMPSTSPPAVAPAVYQPPAQVSRPEQVQPEPENQSELSGFLPPIRRSSTFGLGFGKKNARPRFPIEDEEDGVPQRLQKSPPPPQQSNPHREAQVAGATAVAGIAGHQMNRAPPGPISSPYARDEQYDPPPGPPPGWRGGTARQSVENRQVAPSMPTQNQIPPSQPVAPIQQRTSMPPPAARSQQQEQHQPPPGPPPGWQSKTQRDMLENQQAPSPKPNALVKQQAPKSQPVPSQQPVRVSPPVAAIQQQIPKPQPAPGTVQQAPISQSNVFVQRQAPSSIAAPPVQPQTQAPQQLTARPAMSQPSLSGQSQRSVPQDRDTQRAGYLPPRAADVPQFPQNFQQSQVEWRPNRPKAVPSVSQQSAAYYKETEVSPPPRNSWEPQRGRGYSGSSQNYPQRPDDAYRAPIQGRPFEQPPSSAQRFPELFRPQPQGTAVPRDPGDLPDHYYQAQLPREAAFLPRQQSTEYQLPGVGPPADDPPPTAKRNSGLFKEIGDRLSRASSRERRNSVSRDGAVSPPRHSDHERNEYAESSVTSEEAQEQRKRRSSFFGNLNRASTSGLGPPQSRESVIAHQSGSRTDLLSSQPSPVSQHERKRSFFGSHSGEQKPKPNKLSRASTGAIDGKKNRFSGLSGIFGKGSQSARGSVSGAAPQPTRELSYHERQPIESPHPDQRTPVRPTLDTRGSSSSRTALGKPVSNSSPGPQNKSRRPSASGLLNSMMGRRSNQGDRGSDDSRSQGSQPKPQLGGPQPILLAQTYTDLQEQQAPPPQQPQTREVPWQDEKMRRRPQQREIPFQDPSIRPPDRGRPINREPQYDSVPIPGGYDLVRGQGAMAAPTRYDPRGVGRGTPQSQLDPRFAPLQARGPPQPQGRAQQYPMEQQRPQQFPPNNHDPPLNKGRPNLSALETYQNNTATRRLSREDVLARSPPKSPEGQQRPYQITLPEAETDDEPTPPRPLAKDIPKFPTPPLAKPIQRLQQSQTPALRHPESPAGYPLPDDSVFSPVNEEARNLPPPPPPKWPDQMGQRQEQGHGRHDSIAPSLSTLDNREVDLDRSNTRRTAVSAISGMSAGAQSPGLDEMLNVPSGNQSHSRREEDVEGGRDRHVSSPSPTPPSAMGTPERRISPEPVRQGLSPPPARGNSGQIKTTEISLPNHMDGAHNDDLYSASPRLPKDSQFPKQQPQQSSSSLSPPSASAGGSRNGTSNGGNNLRAKENLKNGGLSDEKIHVQGGHIDEGREDEEPSMSATSYPGQEWNPYGMGGWEEGFD